MKTRRTVMTWLLMLLMLWQPVLVLGAHGCQSDAEHVAMQEHDHDAMNMNTDTAGSHSGQHDGCDCGCYCGGVCVHGCSTSVVTGTWSGDMHFTMPSPPHTLTTFLLSAHPAQYLRPPNRA